MVKRLIVGVSGASGVIYGVRLLEVLKGFPDLQTHLVLTKPAERTLAEETGRTAAQLRELASACHAVGDLGAPLASGSFLTAGMVVIPCSIRTLSAIAWGFADNLLTRAADVTLKEGRRLVLVVRETPLHVGHLKSLLAAAEAGAVIFPPVPAFYTRPSTIDDVVNHTVGRVLDQFDLPHDLVPRWGEAPKGPAAG